jgi:hypothetical protein
VRRCSFTCEKSVPVAGLLQSQGLLIQAYAPLFRGLISKGSPTKITLRVTVKWCKHSAIDEPLGSDSCQATKGLIYPTRNYTN